MPWKECSKMDQKVKFIARLLEGEKMAPLCREFNISRKTGYQIFERYKRFGQEAFIEQKRTPYRYANKLPVQLEMLILDLKNEFPDWGAPAPKRPCPGAGGNLKGESPKMVFTKTSINKNRRFPNEREPKFAAKRQRRSAQFTRHELACHSAARIRVAA
jgi:hypothetical protein